jgi:hypothetical protein
MKIYRQTGSTYTNEKLVCIGEKNLSINLIVPELPAIFSKELAANFAD